MSQRIAAAIGRLWHDRSGVTAILTAFGALILVGFTGLAIDVVTWELTQHKMQSAADAAALAGSIASYANQNVSNAVETVTASYGFIDGQGGTNVSVNFPSNEVQVVLSQPQPQFFTRLFLATAPTVTVAAAAYLPRPGSGSMCVMTLDASGKLAVGSATFTGSTLVNMSNCDLYNNSTAANSTELNGSSVLDVRNMYLAGDYSAGGNASLAMTGTAATYVAPADDPYAGLSIPSTAGGPCNTYSDTPTSTTTITPSGSTPYLICGNLHVQGKLTLGAGVYVIDSGNFTVDAGASITGTGVTLILTSSTGTYGTVTINGGATMSLTAPISGTTAGIALWVDKNAPYAAADYLNGGSNQNINGVIYMPDQQVSFNGGTSGVTTCLQLIALDVTFSGNSNTYITQSGCSADNLPVKQPPLPPALAS